MILIVVYSTTVCAAEIALLWDRWRLQEFRRLGGEDLLLSGSCALLWPVLLAAYLAVKLNVWMVRSLDRIGR